MLDPLALTLAAAPYDDEPLDEDSFASERDQSVAHDKVLDELGLTSEDFARMGRTPLVS
jgi:predicted transcriptional regulator